jgi:hypothetical protein
LLIVKVKDAEKESNANLPKGRATTAIDCGFE